MNSLIDNKEAANKSVGAGDGPTTDEWLDALVTEVEQRRDEFDRLTYVPRDVVASMKRARTFRASTPKCSGGDALPPEQFLRMVERITQADGSARWVAAFGWLCCNTELRRFSTATGSVFCQQTHHM